MRAEGTARLRSMAERYRRPDWVRRLNAMADAVGGGARPIVPLDGAGVLDEGESPLGGRPRARRPRFLLARELDEHPPIADERVAAPVIVTGPARSGTSILFELLALDPELRAPLACEGLHPLPRRPAGEGGAGRAWSECEQELWADGQPEFSAMHELRSDLPVECVTLTIPCFCGPHWLMIAQLGDWAPDVDEMYAFHQIGRATV